MLASAVGAAGGTQAPFTSYKGPQLVAHAGSVAMGKSVVSAKFGQPAAVPLARLCSSGKHLPILLEALYCADMQGSNASQTASRAML